MLVLITGFVFCTMQADVQAKNTCARQNTELKTNGTVDIPHREDKDKTIHPFIKIHVKKLESNLW